ncbi:hypothetical protein B0T10DRAFT_101342 [Thelonectria olida]|uniref:Uncharacterized protein n=1 Tax=Thelonectria olida TaxID=1576542 RepID=A0A9P8WDI3_9HYPO|nr:hypothetical protein B0T10DRAFT_101342 [Thelonectria olida]
MGSVRRRGSKGQAAKSSKQDDGIKMAHTHMNSMIWTHGATAGHFSLGPQPNGVCSAGRGIGSLLGQFPSDSPWLACLADVQRASSFGRRSLTLPLSAAASAVHCPPHSVTCYSHLPVGMSCCCAARPRGSPRSHWRYGELTVVGRRGHACSLRTGTCTGNSSLKFSTRTPVHIPTARYRGAHAIWLPSIFGEGGERHSLDADDDCRCDLGTSRDPLVASFLVQRQGRAHRVR